MRHWLQAKAEEERTRQEEEKTRQEGLRLEQRRVEMDMLRDSLRGGIPPPMIPLVFAGMGSGILPQAALEWAQQFFPPAQSHHLQLPPSQRQQSPEPHHREGTIAPQAPGQYSTGAGNPTASGPPSGPPPPPPPQPGPGPGYGPYPASPSRPRGQTIGGVPGRTTAGGGGGGGGSNVTHTGQPRNVAVSPYGQQSHMHSLPPAPAQDASPVLYFHHWQPPAAQSGSSAASSNRPATPSGASRPSRK